MICLQYLLGLMNVLYSKGIWTACLGFLIIIYFILIKRRRSGRVKMNDESQLVEEARRLLVTSGNAQQDVARAMQALAALVAAVRIKDGDGAATALLERGRALFQEREGTDAERDHALMALSDDNSLLKERGAETILNDAFSDGSSVLCRQCAGLVARGRWEAHKTQWCTAITSRYNLIDDEDDDDDNRANDDRMEVE